MRFRVLREQMSPKAQARAAAKAEALLAALYCRCVTGWRTTDGRHCDVCRKPFASGTSGMLPHGVLMSDELLDQRVIGHGDGQMHAIEDVNDGKVDDLIRHRLRLAYIEAFSHPATDQCPDMECMMCAMRDCPDNEPLHYHHDGCPCCGQSQTEEPPR
jgi:hypothetical protein